MVKEMSGEQHNGRGFPLSVLGMLENTQLFIYRQNNSNDRDTKISQEYKKAVEIKEPWIIVEF